VTKTDYFSFTERNPGHWDVYAFTTKDEEGKPAKERAFCIRGGPHDGQWGWDTTYWIRDERESTRNTDRKIQDVRFPDLPSAVAWITSTLMKAPIDGK
jgi:hypothetical protein